MAKTGGFHPVTKKEEFYESKPFRLYDTQGYEISKKNDLKATVRKISNLIESKNKENNPDKFIHCIWYCVSGTRFEKDEENVINKLLDMYPDKNMPIIIIYLRALVTEWVNNIKKGIKKD